MSAVTHASHTGSRNRGGQPGNSNAIKLGALKAHQRSAAHIGVLPTWFLLEILLAGRTAGPGGD
jgi:hypothetical protein